MITESNNIVELYHQYDDAVKADSRIFIYSPYIKTIEILKNICSILYIAEDLNKEVSTKEMAEILIKFYEFEPCEELPVYATSLDLYAVNEWGADMDIDLESQEAINLEKYISNLD